MTRRNPEITAKHIKNSDSIPELVMSAVMDSIYSMECFECVI